MRYRPAGAFTRRLGRRRGLVVVDGAGPVAVDRHELMDRIEPRATLGDQAQCFVNRVLLGGRPRSLRAVEQVLVQSSCLTVHIL
jgi:hypothetical protein